MFYILAPIVILIIILAAIIPQIIADSKKSQNQTESEQEDSFSPQEKKNINKTPKTEKELIKSYNKLSLTWGVIGIIMRIFYYLMLFRGSFKGSTIATDFNNTIGGIILLLSAIFLLIGFIYYLKAKGRSKWWSLFVFTPLIICLIVLISLKKNPLIVENSELDIIHRKN